MSGLDLVRFRGGFGEEDIGEGWHNRDMRRGERGVALADLRRRGSKVRGIGG